MVEQEADRWLKKGKVVAVLGGDHATPLGSIRAHAKHFPDMGILHIDAHCDLREAFEGFTYSHASIMWNVLAETTVPKLVQVGIRDFSQGERAFVQKEHKRIRQYFDQSLAERMFRGESWDALCKGIARALPQDVYISFDIDGLERSMCPGTGTPVPGGFTFQQVVHLLQTLVAQKKNIVGFDLVEVSPQRSTEWNENVGARMLFQLIGWTLASRKNA
jgi:agmatinase